MKKIIVAGCGHGGLTAAVNLSKAGFDVTVIEKEKRENLGYEWQDTIRRKTFEKSGIPTPPEEELRPFPTGTYHNPGKDVTLTPAEKESNKNLAFIDRKFLIRHLIDCAEEAEVKFLFECSILSAVTEDKRVIGVKYITDGKECLSVADLVIDACGIGSNVRKSLPPNFRIPRVAGKSDIFHTYRACFKKNEKIENNSRINIYFYHCDHPGMDWVIDEDEYCDILVGGFGELKQSDVEKALADFREEYPYIGDEIVGGGKFNRIPLAKTPPIFVCDGYAAVGDSAFMTESMSGSGMDMSMQSGKILADVVLENRDASISTLWKYNYAYFKEFAEKDYNNYAIKSLMSSLTADDIDFFMRKRILTEIEIGGGKYTDLKQLTGKLNLLTRPTAFAPLMKAVKKLSMINKLKKSIPEEYENEKIKEWIRIYSEF